MALVNLDDLDIGQIISFTTINPYDNTLYQGEIISRSKYDVVKELYDLIPYYAQVKKVLPNIEPIDKLMYFTIQYYQGGKKNTKVMAKEWFELSSVMILNVNMKFDIRIYDRENTEVDTILNLLRTHGYKCALV